MFVATRDVWSIGIYTGTSPLHMGLAGAPDNPVLTAAQVTDIPAMFVADPFMLRVQQTWSMLQDVCWCLPAPSPLIFLLSVTAEEDLCTNIWYSSQTLS